MKSSTVKLCKSQRKMNYTRQNENSLDSLPCVTMLDYDSTLVIICSKSKLEAISDLSTFLYFSYDGQDFTSQLMNSVEMLNCKIQNFHYCLWLQNS